MKMISNGKIWDYKVVDLVEIYNFHIKFISIRVQTKNYKCLKRDRPLPPCPTAVGPCRHPPRRQMYSFAKKKLDHIYCKEERKM
jgi:hypothetical protein